MMPPIKGLRLLTIVFFSFAIGEGKILPDIRLPKSIVPEHYHVGIVPNIHENKNAIEGFVHLNFFVQSPTDRIVMHAVNLTLNEDSVTVNPLPSKTTEMMRENDVSKTSSNASYLSSSDY